MVLENKRGMKDEYIRKLIKHNAEKCHIKDCIISFY